jgi:hypothetical protein
VKLVVAEACIEVIETRLSVNDEVISSGFEVRLSVIDGVATIPV